MEKERIKDLFEQMLDIMDIKLVKTKNGYRLWDNQRQQDYDKDDLNYHYNDTYSVIERLDDLICDYFVRELEEEPHFDIDGYSNYEDLLNQIGDSYLDEEVDGMYDINIFILDMIVHAQNVKLNKLFKGEQ